MKDTEEHHLGVRPVLKEIRFLKNNWGSHAYPFNIPAFGGVESIRISRPVTFFIGENGSGKSTLLEAVADLCGFYTGGGSRNNLFPYQATESALKKHLRLSWMPKVADGFFLRAETILSFCLLYR